jgi:Asp-tRNA(Asn)/Glu-tRNA(Gln) amidotransferase A subunit family amidase
MQIIGKPFDEGTVLRVADAFQRHIYKPSQWPAMI